MTTGFLAVASWQAKQERRGGDPAKFAEAIKLSPAEGAYCPSCFSRTGTDTPYSVRRVWVCFSNQEHWSPVNPVHLVWNTHIRIPKDTAVAHIQDLLSLTPYIATETPFAPSDLPVEDPEAPLDLDTPDEQASRFLLLGILHRTAGEYALSRAFLEEAVSRKAEIIDDTWIVPTAVFELATLDLREVDAELSEQRGDDAQPHPDAKRQWESTINVALGRLDEVSSLVVNTDLSSRLESRVVMLRDEIGYKKAALGL